MDKNQGWQGSNKPENIYDKHATNGARIAHGQEIRRTYTSQGSTVNTDSSIPDAIDVSQMYESKNKTNTGVSSQQPKPQPRPQQTVQNNTQNQPPNNNNNKKPPKKKGKGGKILLIILIIIIILIVISMVKKKNNNTDNNINDSTTQTANTEASGRELLDKLLVNLNSFNATELDTLIGTEDGDSYLAQEWAYVNAVPLREEFITRVGAIVQFTYPSEDSLMNSGESLTVTVPDYNALTEAVKSEELQVKQLFLASGYSSEDYTWNDELTNLMIQYILDRGELPTKQVTITPTIRLTVDGTPYLVDDAELDDILFGNEELRTLCTEFSKICTNWTGYKDEEYTVKEEKHNKEYDKWFKLFIKYYKQDGGKYNKKTGKFSGGRFDKNTSKWEPWYLYDDNNKVQLDKKGNKIVNYYSVKKKDGTDWIQPSETVLVKVTKTRQVEDPWVNETGIMFNWIGTHYIETVYNGLGSKVTRVGDGSKERPAGIGTSVITKILCTDGVFHDVRVTVLGYWTEQDAIDYAEKFSTKNRGFTTSAVVQLITFEVQVENLESNPITFELPEMALCDDNGNISPRTGVMYAFSENITVNPHEKVIVNDWASSTELAQKYVVWGRNFNTGGKMYPLVYFDILAGTGEIPPYSAYEQFTGKSSMSTE